MRMPPSADGRGPVDQPLLPPGVSPREPTASDFWDVLAVLAVDRRVCRPGTFQAVAFREAVGRLAVELVADGRAARVAGLSGGPCGRGLAVRCLRRAVLAAGEWARRPPSAARVPEHELAADIRWQLAGIPAAARRDLADALRAGRPLPADAPGPPPPAFDPDEDAALAELLSQLAGDTTPAAAARRHLADVLRAEVLDPAAPARPGDGPADTGHGPRDGREVRYRGRLVTVGGIIYKLIKIMLY